MCFAGIYKQGAVEKNAPRAVEKNAPRAAEKNVPLKNTSCFSLCTG